jgi:hypothetical protein
MVNSKEQSISIHAGCSFPRYLPRLMQPEVVLWHSLEPVMSVALYNISYVSDSKGLLATRPTSRLVDHQCRLLSKLTSMDLISTLSSDLHFPQSEPFVRVPLLKCILVSLFSRSNYIPTSLLTPQFCLNTRRITQINNLLRITQ